MFRLHIIKDRKNDLATFQHVTKLIETVFGLCIALGKHSDVNTRAAESFIDGVESMLTLDE
jgi:hypothetical protein